MPARVANDCLVSEYDLLCGGDQESQVEKSSEIVPEGIEIAFHEMWIAQVHPG